MSGCCTRCKEVERVEHVPVQDLIQKLAEDRPRWLDQTLPATSRLRARGSMSGQGRDDVGHLLEQVHLRLQSEFRRRILVEVGDPEEQILEFPLAFLLTGDRVIVQPLHASERHLDERARVSLECRAAREIGGRVGPITTVACLGVGERTRGQLGDACGAGLEPACAAPGGIFGVERECGILVRFSSVVKLATETLRQRERGNNE